MTIDFHDFEAADGHGLAHDPFLAIVGPRPIGWISTRSRAGTCNLAPFSFFNAFSHGPPILGFSSTGRKDTLVNVEETGEFVWNLATVALANAMNISSAEVPPHIDEFALAGLTPRASTLVEAPRVAEARVSLECRLLQVVQLHDLEGTPLERHLVIGQVVAGHIDKQLIVDGRYDTAAARPILRAGGSELYARIEPEAMFAMPRPR